MVDPEAEQGTPPPGTPPPGTPLPGAVSLIEHYLPLAAYPVPSTDAPPAPTWTRTYEVPTARKIVSSGLQLAVEASRAIRRASIYIGLLALGAFGPAILLLLIGIGRLLGDPATAATMASDPSLIFLEQPEIVGPLALIYFMVAAGIVLLIAISIDAQAMAIALLGGHASDQPLRLWEAITRARQVFWRLLGAGFLVGIVSTIVTLVLTLPFLRPFDSNTGLTFVASMIGALVVTPFAFASAGIVLGDVGAIEALRRSVALFRARPRISLVVTLFTLVTSAIQTFAIGAGADAAVRVGELMHLNLEQGGVPLVITAVIVLAFIVAFGSLTFTIAAIVAAPQVTGFLGLTYYSGGLDRARSSDAVRPRGFRWVSRGMVVTMVGLLLLAGLNVSSVAGFRIRPASAILTLLRSAAEDEGAYVSAFGPSSLVEDPIGDGAPTGHPAADIVAAEFGYLSEVPSWLLDRAFDCTDPDVTCGRGGSLDEAFTSEGAILVAQRMALRPAASGGSGLDWGPVLHVEGALVAPSLPGDRFPGASHVIVTHFGGGERTIQRFERFTRGSFAELSTDARSVWVGDALITLIPVSELGDWPVAWDIFAVESAATPDDEIPDFLRRTPADPMLPMVEGPDYLFLADFENPFGS